MGHWGLVDPVWRGFGAQRNLEGCEVQQVYEPCDEKRLGDGRTRPHYSANLG